MTSYLCPRCGRFVAALAEGSCPFCLVPPTVPLAPYPSHVAAQNRVPVSKGAPPGARIRFNLVALQSIRARIASIQNELPAAEQKARFYQDRYADLCSELVDLKSQLNGTHGEATNEDDVRRCPTFSAQDVPTLPGFVVGDTCHVRGSAWLYIHRVGLTTSTVTYVSSHRGLAYCVAKSEFAVRELVDSTVTRLADYDAVNSPRPDPVEVLPDGPAPAGPVHGPSTQDEACIRSLVLGVLGEVS